MSGRTQKKIRQVARKKYREHYQELAEAEAKRNAGFLKPCPRWCPEWLWMRGLRIFVKIK